MKQEKKNELIQKIDKLNSLREDYNHTVEDGKRKMKEIRKRQLKELGLEE